MVIVLFDVKLKNTTFALRNAELVAHLQESLANTPGFIKSESFVKDGDPLHMMDITYWEDEVSCYVLANIVNIAWLRKVKMGCSASM